MKIQVTLIIRTVSVSGTRVKEECGAHAECAGVSFYHAYDVCTAGETQWEYPKELQATEAGTVPAAIVWVKGVDPTSGHPYWCVMWSLATSLPSLAAHAAHSAW